MDNNSDSDSDSELDNISISSSDNETTVSLCISEAVSENSYCDTFSLDNLTNDDIADILIDIYEQIDAYVQENILKISLPTFYSDICNDIAETIYMEWESAGICDEDTGSCLCHRGYSSSNGDGGPGPLGDCGWPTMFAKTDKAFRRYSGDLRSLITQRTSFVANSDAQF